MKIPLALQSWFASQFAQPRAAVWIGSMLLVAWLSFGGLGTRDVTRKAEARCAQTAQEMLTSGDWVVPTFGESPRLEKPPLMYWLIAASSVPFGRVTEASAMIPVALSGLGIALIVMAWGQQIMGRRGGILAGLILATSPGIFIKGHHIEAEMTLAFFVTLAMWLYSRRWSGVSRSSVELCIAHVSLALAFLTKGPPALVFPVAAFGTLAIMSRWRPQLKSSANLWLLLGCTLAVAAVFPWVIAVSIRQPGAFSEWWGEIIGKRVGSESSHGEPTLYYVNHLLPLMLPWLLLLPLAAQSLRAPHWRRDWAPVVAWALMGLVAFSLFGGKRWYYLLPIFPPVALLAGKGLEAWIEPLQLRSQLDRATGWILVIVCVALAAGAPVFAITTAIGLRVASLIALVWGGLACAMGLIALVAAVRQHRRAAAWWILIAASLFWATYRFSFWPMENRWKSGRVIASWIRDAVPEGHAILCFQTNATGLQFYLNRPTVKVDNAMDLRGLMREMRGRPVMLITESDELEDLASFPFELAVEEIDGRQWDDFDFTLVRVTGMSVSDERMNTLDASL